MACAIDWIISASGASISGFHLVGFSLGAHMIGVAGRNVRSGRIPYITGEDSFLLNSPFILSLTINIYLLNTHVS